ncbi:MAG: hypothetical protein RBS43_03210 [Candidatus Cloacimonas sp.]|nr:hypothetical protein [Candidatus Cloacimonas sp.]
MLDLEDLIVPFSNYKGDWVAYNEAIYSFFYEDFIDEYPKYRMQDVGIKVWTIEDGKAGTFWHITSEEPKHTPRGYQRHGRIPDFKRSERVRWIREIIENPTDPNVKRWIEKIKGQDRHHLWYKDEFLVVLGVHPNYPYYRLVTSFYTQESERYRYQLRFENLGDKKGDAAVATSYPFKP